MISYELPMALGHFGRATTAVLLKTR